MIAKYTLPVTGTCKRITPLEGDINNPIDIVPILSTMPTKLRTRWSYVCAEPNLQSETMEITLDADEKIHQWLEAEIKSVSKLHDLIAKHGFKSLKRLDKKM